MSMTLRKITLKSFFYKSTTFMHPSLNGHLKHLLGFRLCSIQQIQFFALFAKILEEQENTISKCTCYVQAD